MVEVVEVVEVAAFMTITLLTQFAADLDQLPNVAISSMTDNEDLGNRGLVVRRLSQLTTESSKLETVYGAYGPWSVCFPLPSFYCQAQISFAFAGF